MNLPILISWLGRGTCGLWHSRNNVGTPFGRISRLSRGLVRVIEGFCIAEDYIGHRERVDYVDAMESIIT